MEYSALCASLRLCEKIRTSAKSSGMYSDRNRVSYPDPSLIFRNTILSYYLDKKIVSFNNRYHAELVVEKARIRWLTSIRVTGISLRPDEGDTLVKIDTATASLSFFRMIFGSIALSDFELRNTRITMVRHDSITNYMFLLDRGPKLMADTAFRESDYAARLSGIYDAVFEKLPDALVISNFNVRVNSNGHNVGLFVSRLAIEDHRFIFPVEVTEDTTTAEWIVEGLLDKHERLIDSKMYAMAGGPVTIPYISYRWNAGISFDTLAFSMGNSKGSGW